MTQIITIVLPVFGLIGIGYCVAWTRLLSVATGDALVDFVFTIAIPLLIFRTVTGADFSAAAPWRIWVPYFGVFALMWIAGHFVVRRLFGRDARAGLVAGVSAAYGNTVLVGIPLALAAYGSEGAVAVALIIAVHLPVMMTASALLIGRAEQADGVSNAPVNLANAARSVAQNLLLSPIIIGIIAGVAWRLTGWHLGGVPGALVNRIADVASTLALFSMGMSLRKYGIRGNVAAGLVLSGLKLIVMPALVLVVTRYVFPLPPVWMKVAVIAAACPTGVNAFLVASRFRTGEALASNAITLSTALAVVSVSFWLHAVEWF